MAIKILEITIEEFEKDAYKKYIELFPEDERRPLKNIAISFSKGIEKIYKILLNDQMIGFVLLEKIFDYPYYLDYFAILKEYQNNGYGTQAMQLIIEKFSQYGIIGEIEKVVDSDSYTKKRHDFYKNLGFEDVDSEYLLYDVLYTPIVCNVKKEKATLDKIFFDYYIMNNGENMIKKNCRIIR